MSLKQLYFLEYSWVEHSIHNFQYPMDRNLPKIRRKKLISFALIILNSYYKMNLISRQSHYKYKKIFFGTQFNFTAFAKFHKSNEKVYS